jgi:hypothetical protein
VGVLDLIEGNNEALPVVGVEKMVRIGVWIWIDLGHYSLVIRRAAEALELIGRRLGCPPDPMDPPPAPLGLGDGPTSVDPLALGH